MKRRRKVTLIMERLLLDQELFDFEKFLRYERFLSEFSIQKYIFSLGKLKEFLRTDLFSTKLLSEISKEDISRFLIYLKNKYTNNNTIMSYIVSMRTFYSWVAYKYGKKELMEINFFIKNIIKVKHERVVPFVPSTEEIMQLRKTLKTYKQLLSYNTDSSHYKKTVMAYAIFELLITTGVRSNELRNLRYQDVDLDNKTIFIKCGKGGHQRISLFGMSAAEVLKEYLALNNFSANDLIFPIKQGNILHYMVKRWARRAKINSKLHIHSFRHYFITESQRQGVAMEVVANQVGHRNLNSTRHYSHFDIGHIKDKYKAVEI